MPHIEDDAIAWQQVHADYVRVQRWSAVILVSVLAVLGLAAWLAMVILAVPVVGWTSLAVAGGGGLAWLALTYLFWHEPQWRYEKTWWRELPHGLEIRRGIWWWHRIFVPRVRIQHTDVVRGPLMRRFGLATLVVYTAGTQNHEIPLEGLTLEVAERLRRSLLPTGRDMDSGAHS